MTSSGPMLFCITASYSRISRSPDAKLIRRTRARLCVIFMPLFRKRLYLKNRFDNLNLIGERGLGRGKTSENY